MRKYTCALCKEEFETDATEAECDDEAKENFPDWDGSDKAVICTPCFDDVKEFHDRAKPLFPKLKK